MGSTIQISEIVQSSWRFVKSQIWILAGLMLGLCIIYFTISLLCMPLWFSSTGQWVGNILCLLIGSIFSVGYIKNMFQTMDGEEPQFSAYLQSVPKILNMLIGNVLFNLICAIGLLFLVLPGIYLALRFMFFAQYIVEENLSAIDALKQSWRITEGQVGNLLLLALAELLITLIGFILLGIGIFVALPLIYMMQCYAFRKLNNPLSQNIPL